MSNRCEQSHVRHELHGPTTSGITWCFAALHERLALCGRGICSGCSHSRAAQLTVSGADRGTSSPPNHLGVCAPLTRHPTLDSPLPHIPSVGYLSSAACASVYTRYSHSTAATAPVIGQRLPSGFPHVHRETRVHVYTCCNLTHVAPLPLHRLTRHTSS